MVYKTENRLVMDFKKSFMSSITSSDGLILLEEVKTNWGIVDILAIRYDSQKLKYRRKIIKGKQIQNFTNITSYAISHIIEKPYLTIEELGAHLKIKNGLLISTVKNLADRNLIHRYKNNTLRAKSIRNNYIIKEILAFEAKLSNWQKAVNQSERHLWFTNSSFIVLPELSKTVTARVHKACAERGIGFIVQNSKNKFQIVKQPLYKKHIDSIISWKINEALVDRSKFNGANPLK